MQPFANEAYAPVGKRITYGADRRFPAPIQIQDDTVEGSVNYWVYKEPGGADVTAEVGLLCFGPGDRVANTPSAFVPILGSAVVFDSEVLGAFKADWSVGSDPGQVPSGTVEAMPCLRPTAGGRLVVSAMVPDVMGPTTKAKVTQERIERETADGGLAALITTVSVIANDNTALINSEQVARIDADEVLASDIGIVQALAGNNAAAITTEETARINQDGVLASSIASVQAIANDNAGLIANEAIVRANQDGVLSARLDTTEANTANNAAAITTEETARTDADTALSSLLQTVEALANNNAGQVGILLQTTADNAGAIESRAVIQSSAGANLARILLQTVSGVTLSDQEATILGNQVRIENGDALLVLLGNLARLNVPLEIVDAGEGAYIRLKTDDYQVILGAGFGLDDDLVLWMGPPTTAISQMTRANSYFAPPLIGQTRPWLDGSPYIPNYGQVQAASTTLGAAGTETPETPARTSGGGSEVYTLVFKRRYVRKTTYTDATQAPPAGDFSLGQFRVRRGREINNSGTFFFGDWYFTPRGTRTYSYRHQDSLGNAVLYNDGSGTTYLDVVEEVVIDETLVETLAAPSANASVKYKLRLETDPWGITNNGAQSQFMSITVREDP